jgi:mycothiol synthase
VYLPVACAITPGWSGVNGSDVNGAVAMRPLALADVEAWAQLLAAVEEVDRTGEHYSAADLAEAMGDPEVEVGKDFVGAVDPDGQLVGYWAVQPRGPVAGQYTVEMQGAVLPARRGQGIGTTMVAGMIERATQVRDERGPDLLGRLVTTGGTSDAEQAALLGAAGLLGERWTFVMRAALDAVPPARPVPDGYQVRPYDRSVDDAVREAHNAAFLDHPGFTPLSEARWRQSVTESRNFRPDVSFVATTDGSADVVAYVQTAEFEADFAATGRREAYVAKVGTLREHRGRGLAGALLGHALQAYREAGYDESALAVDSQNPTGALGVYRRVGFTVESRFTNYVLRVGIRAG